MFSIEGLLCSLLVPLLVLMGLFGNTVTVYIFLKKLKARNRHAVYVSAIAIACSCNLVVTGGFWLFVGKGLPWISSGRLTMSFDDWPIACGLWQYVKSLSNLLPVALFLLLLADRVLSLRPKFGVNSMPPSSAAAASAATAVVCCLLVLPVGVESQAKAASSEFVACYLATGHPSLTLVWYHEHAVCMVPTLLLACTVVGTVCLLVEMHRSVQRLPTDQRPLLASGEEWNLSMQTLLLSSVLLILSLPMMLMTVTHVTLIALGRMPEEAFRTLRSGFTMSLVPVLAQQSLHWLLLLVRSGEYRTSFCETFGLRRRQPRRRAVDERADAEARMGGD